MSLLHGIDISVYQGIVPEVAWRCFWQDGQRVAVIGSAHPGQNPYAVANFTNAKAAGFEYLATYLALSPTISGLETVRRAKQACGPFWTELCFVAVDAEIDGITKQQIADALGAVKAEGLRAVLYTGGWWWSGHFGNPTDFKDVPLWAAQYDGKPDLDVAPYGGWTSAAGKQYTGTTPLCGVDVDKNVFDAAFIASQEDDMPKIIGTSYKNTYWAFACDGMQRVWLANPGVVAGLQAAGALSSAPAGFMARDLLVTVPCIGPDPIA